MKEQLIIDCDPGVDDAIAIMLAVASPRIELLAVTTVAGNVSLAHTTKNALKILSLCGAQDVPVFKGAARPLLLEEGRLSLVHGQNGLGDIKLPEPERDAETKHAVNYIVDTIRSAPDKSITLAAIGPLTNIALAFSLAPEIIPKIKSLAIMGGAMNVPGNITPTAEFNFYVDPTAANIVVRSGARAELYGLNLTEQVRVDPVWIDNLIETGPVSGVAKQILTAYSELDPALHDPCVIAGIIDPSLFSGGDYMISVDTRHGMTEGQMIVEHEREGGATVGFSKCKVIERSHDTQKLLSLVAELLDEFH